MCRVTRPAASTCSTAPLGDVVNHETAGVVGGQRFGASWSSTIDADPSGATRASRSHPPPAIHTLPSEARANVPGEAATAGTAATAAATTAVAPCGLTRTSRRPPVCVAVHRLPSGPVARPPISLAGHEHDRQRARRVRAHEPVTGVEPGLAVRADRAAHADTSCVAAVRKPPPGASTPDRVPVSPRRCSPRRRPSGPATSGPDLGPERDTSRPRSRGPARRASPRWQAQRLDSPCDFSPRRPPARARRLSLRECDRRR